MPEVNRFLSIPTRILLPIDFSPSSQAALEMAADLARHFQAETLSRARDPDVPDHYNSRPHPETVFLEKARKTRRRAIWQVHGSSRNQE